MLQKVREKKRLITFFAIFLFFLWFAGAIFTVQHESVHRKICRNFDGENVTTYTNYSLPLTGAETFCSNVTDREGLKLQMQTEIVGYHVEVLMITAFLGVLLLVTYLELKEGKCSA